MCRGTNYKWYTLNFAKPTFNLFKKFAAKKCMKKNHTHPHPFTHNKHTHAQTHIPYTNSHLQSSTQSYRMAVNYIIGIKA